MADRKEWKEQLLSKLLDQYEKSVTYAGENKVKQVFGQTIRYFQGLQQRFSPAGTAFPGKRI